MKGAQTEPAISFTLLKGQKTLDGNGREKQLHGLCFCELGE